MRCILFGATGEVGGAVARALLRSEVCSQLTVLGRRAIASMKDEAKLNQVVVDMSAANLEEVVQEHARGHEAAISCLGIGSGTAGMSEAQMLAVEVDLVGKIARGCKAAGIGIFELLTAVGVNEHSASSKFKYFRVLGMKLNTVRAVGFEKLAVFKPGMIVGNAHTPNWMTPFTGLIPDALGVGNIRQDEVARAFVAHLEKGLSMQREPVVSYGNKEMKQLIQE